MGGMNTGEKTDLRSAAIMPVIGYAVIRIRCSPMVVLAHETLECTGIDSRIALADVAGVELCKALLRHDRRQPYVGRYLRTTSTTTTRCGSTTAPRSLNDGNDLLPPVALIIDTACERAGSIFGSDCR